MRARIEWFSDERDGPVVAIGLTVTARILCSLVLGLDRAAMLALPGAERPSGASRTASTMCLALDRGSALPL